MREVAVLVWDLRCREQFQQRVLHESTIETETEVCWQWLLSAWPAKAAKVETSEVARLNEFIDRAFEILSDHLDKVDWICRDIWASDGSSVGADFVREVLSSEIADQIEKHAAAIDSRLKTFMHEEEFGGRRPVLHHYENATKQMKQNISYRYDEEARRLECSGVENGQPASNEHSGTRKIMAGPCDVQVRELERRNQRDGLSIEEKQLESVPRRMVPTSETEPKNRRAAALTPIQSDGETTKRAEGPEHKNREAFLRETLEKKGFSVHDWAKQASVDFHTADDFLKGKTRPYPSTRRKLLDALGVKTEDLPD
jgi:hypothetical protein